MPRRWLVNTSNNRTVGVIDDDHAPVRAGRMAVAQAVIVASGTPRADIKTNGLWVVTNGVGAYTAPTPATVPQVRDRRRITLARNIIKNWLPAATAMLAITDPPVNIRMEVSLNALVHCITVNASIDDHYDTLLAESLVNGFDFVLYAGPQWDNSTNGYYGSSTFPTGSWSFRTINQNHCRVAVRKATPGGINHPNITTNVQSGADAHSIGCASYGSWLTHEHTSIGNDHTGWGD